MVSNYKKNALLPLLFLATTLANAQVEASTESPNLKTRSELYKTYKQLVSRGNLTEAMVVLREHYAPLALAPKLTYNRELVLLAFELQDNTLALEGFAGVAKFLESEKYPSTSFGGDECSLNLVRASLTQKPIDWVAFDKKYPGKKLRSLETTVISATNGFYFRMAQAALDEFIVQKGPAEDVRELTRRLAQKRIEQTRLRESAGIG